MLSEDGERLPLFGPHVPRQEADYDEATGQLQMDEHFEKRPASNSEVFFDLFFAALLMKLGGVLAQQLSRHPVQILHYALIFALIYESWLKVTNYINRFASETASDRAFIYWNVVSLGGVIINARRCMAGQSCQALSCWLVVGRSSLIIWYLLAMFHTRTKSSKGYRFSRYNLATSAVSIVLLGSAAVVGHFNRTAQIALLITAAVHDAGSGPVMWYTLPSYRLSYVPINADLASERLGLIYIIALGELVSSSVTVNIQEDFRASLAVDDSFLMLLGVTMAMVFQASFFRLYDLSAERIKKHALEVSMLRAWATLYLTSVLALLASLIGAVFYRVSMGYFSGTDRQVLTWASCVKVALFSLCSRLHLRHLRPRYGWMVDLLAIAVFSTIALLERLLKLNDLQYMALIVFVWCCLALIRGLILPIKLTEEGVEELESLEKEGKLSESAAKKNLPPPRQ